MNTFPTEEELARARSRLNRDRTLRNTSVAVRTPVQPALPPITKTEETLPQRLGGALSRLSKPLIELPDQTNPILRFGEEALEGLTSPLGIASALLVPVTGGSSLALRGALGAGAKLGTRLLADAAVGAVAGRAAGAVGDVLPKDTNPILRGALQLGAGAVAGGGLGTGIKRLTTDAAAEAAERVARLSAASATPEAATLTEAIANAKAVPQAEQRQLLHAQRVDQSSRFRKALATARNQGKSADEALAAANAAAKGEFKRLSFEKPVIEPELIETLKRQGQDYYFDRGMELSANTINSALEKVLSGSIPPPHELKALEEVFGSGLTEAIRLHQGWGPKVAAAMNFPRALVASADLSAPLRQGVLLAAAHPISFAKNLAPMLRAFADEDYYRSAISALSDGPAALRADSANLARSAGRVIGREEPFIGNVISNKSLAGSIMNASERAYSLYLDKLRRDVFDTFVKKLDAAGLDSLSTEREYAKFLNRATGRGAEKFLEGPLGKVANAAFFAPNYTLSRFLAPKSLFSADDAVRTQVAKDLGAFVGSGIAGLTLFGLAGKSGTIPGLSVETDPRSSDFGKIKLGNTRYDFWGGYQQIARTVAQAASGESKSPTSGRIDDANRFETLARFVQSKLSPVAGYAVDVTRGESFQGDKVDLTPESLEQQAVERLTPLIWQDVMEGFYNDGPQGAAASLPALFGVGTTTFQSLSEIKDDAALRLFKVSDYGDLTGTQKRMVDQDPKVVAKSREYDGKAGDKYSTESDRIDNQRVAAQRAFMGRLGTSMTRREFADAISQATRDASIAKEEARRLFDVPDVAPSSALQMALNSFYNLYDQSDIGAKDGVKTGKIDWDKFETLKSELFSRLTPDEREFIDARARADVDESVQWFFNNSDYISGSSFYKLVDEEFSKYARRVQTIDPSIDSYGELLAVRDSAKLANPTLYRRLNSIYNQISGVAQGKRERLRRNDPALDAALFLTGRTDKLLTQKAKKIAQQDLTN